MNEIVALEILERLENIKGSILGKKFDRKVDFLNWIEGIAYGVLNKRDNPKN